VQLAVPGISLRQHHDPVLFAAMLADQHGAGLEPHRNAELQIRGLPRRNLFADTIQEALRGR
jgi:hypothetical protein